MRRFNTHLLKFLRRYFRLFLNVYLLRRVPVSAEITRVFYLISGFGIKLDKSIESYCESRNRAEKPNKLWGVLIIMDSWLRG